MEFNILSTLSFDLTFPTPLRFLEKICKTAKTDEQILQFASFLIELSLVDIRMLRFKPSIIAGSALILAIQQRLKSNPSLSATYSALLDSSFLASLGLNEEQMAWCVKELKYLHLGSSKSSLQAVRKKYLSSKVTGLTQLINCNL